MTFSVAATVGAVATVGGALIGAGASKSAANKQAAAATRAAELQKAVADRQLDFQREAYQKQLEIQEPWRAAGVNALNRIEAREFNVPGEFRATTGLPGEFRAKTALPGAFTGQVNMQADPGYQFRLSEGLKALDRQAAARGGLISGSALKGAQRYGQDYASGEYQNAYNRALTEYQSRVAQSQMGYGRELDAYNAAMQRSNVGYGRELDAYNAAMQRSTTGYNRLASLAGLGQTSVGQIGSAASAYGSNVGNILGQSGAAQAAGITGAANAQAAGTVGMANALTGGISSGINQYYQNQLMNRLFSSGNDTPATYGWTDQYANDFMGSYGQG